ncbi:hypothetical protein ACQP2X_34300 [Actinoplanes sp. CA-131856]
MRPLTVAIASYGVAMLVAAFLVGLDVTDVQRGAEAATLLTLALCVALAPRAVPRTVWWAVVAFCLLLSASALVELGADLADFPPLPADLPSGCPPESEETTSFWRGQLRLDQGAELLRFLALTAAIVALRRLPPAPHLRRRRAVTGLLLIPVLLYGLYPLSWDYAWVASAPGVMTLAAAAALTFVAATRAENLVLVIGAVLTLLSASTAVEDIARVHGLLPEPEPTAVATACFIASAGSATPWSGRATADIAVALLFLSAPAMIAWSAARVRVRPDPGPERPGRAR